jgi:hypothetical protein
MLYRSSPFLSSLDAIPSSCDLSANQEIIHLLHFNTIEPTQFSSLIDGLHFEPNDGNCWETDEFTQAQSRLNVVGNQRS